MSELKPMFKEIKDEELEQERKNIEEQIKTYKDIEALQKQDYDKNEKLYLVLWYLDTNSEQEHIFEFVKGRQATYDYIKELLKDDEFGPLVDINKSRVLADSPKIQISHYVSIYRFMYDMKYKNLIEDDDSSFDIEDWKDDMEA